MKESNYDSYCGLYCGACDILRCYEKVHESKFASLWTEPTLKAFLKSQGATYSGDDDLKLKCQGCKSDDVFIVCRSCKIRECALSKNFEHCSDCSDFPCEIYNDWKKVQIFLPHINGTQGNLDVIGKVGVDKWLSDQENQWKCPKCNTNFSWYSSNCNNCGYDLKKYTFKFSKLRLLFMKTSIRLTSFREK